MDKYNHWLGKLFGRVFRDGGDYAVTIGQTTYYSCPSDMVHPAWRAEEDCHKEQWAKDGKIKLVTRYLYQWIIKGYRNIDYEIEAKRHRNGE